MGACLQISLHCNCFESLWVSCQSRSGPTSQFQGLLLGVQGVWREQARVSVPAAVCYRETCGIYPWTKSSNRSGWGCNAAAAASGPNDKQRKHGIRRKKSLKILEKVVILQLWADRVQAMSKPVSEAMPDSGSSSDSTWSWRMDSTFLWLKQSLPWQRSVHRCPFVLWEGATFPINLLLLSCFWGKNSWGGITDLSLSPYTMGLLSAEEGHLQPAFRGTKAFPLLSGPSCPIKVGMTFIWPLSNCSLCDSQRYHFK